MRIAIISRGTNKSINPIPANPSCVMSLKMNEPATVNIGVKINAKYMLHITKLSVQERLKVRMKAIIKKIISTADKKVVI